MSIIIRRTGVEDIEEVVCLRLAFLREEQPDALQSEPEFVGLTRQYVADKLPTGEFVVWFAEEDDRIIGTGGLVFFHRPPTFRNTSELQAYVLNMYTLPECRYRGVATMILKHIVEYVKETPAKRISLHASEMGRSIYEKFGFSAIGGGMMLTL